MSTVLPQQQDDTRLLEILLGAEPPKCESRHRAIRECSIEVVARVRYLCDTRHPMVCAETVAYVADCHALDTICDDCDRPTRECWRVIPI